jgi:hypothetical protein
MFSSFALREQKKDTIMIIRGANAKLQHHTSPMPTYSVENEMPFLHHVVK